ncbi:MAG: ATP-binding protein [Marinicella sp.]
MSLPDSIVKRVYDHYQASQWCTVTLNSENHIIETNLQARNELGISEDCSNIRTVLPLMATETLDEEFFIPFYHHEDKIFDVHFLLSRAQKHIILVPIDKFHHQVQYKQQIAHEQVIEKLRIQFLFSTLENAHEELQEANAAKSFYISALSHEMGNPLNAIKGYNELLNEGAINAEQATKIISNNVDKLQEIITQTLDFDQQQQSQYSTPLNPASMIDDLFNNFRIQAQNKGLDLINQVDPEIRILSHETKWNQILTNLISNAIKYTESGSVLVKSIVEGDLLHMDVIDTGCGMSEAFQQQLFTAWSRELKSQSQGNGIGLVISKMLAEQLGAHLILHSSNPSGSRFRFSSSFIKPFKRQSILLVDDDVDCLSLFTYYLEHAGHQVTTADTLAGLVEQLDKNTFDVLITDLNLPDGQAVEIYSHAQSKVNKLVVMTANPSTDQQTTLFQHGFDQVLSKPLNQEQIVNSVA